MCVGVLHWYQKDHLFANEQENQNFTEGHTKKVDGTITIPNPT